MSMYTSLLNARIGHVTGPGQDPGGGPVTHIHTKAGSPHTRCVGCKKAGSVDTGWPVANVTSIASQLAVFRYAALMHIYN